MNTKMITAALIVLSSALFAADTQSLASKYATYSQTRRYCVSRVVKDGKVITTWYRDGRPDWLLPSVETNTLRNIAGAKQNNPLQDKIASLNSELQDFNTRLQTALADYATSSNRAARAEARLTKAKANLTASRDEWQSKYDSAAALGKPIYKLGLDLIDGIIKKIDGDDAE